MHSKLVPMTFPNHSRRDVLRAGVAAAFASGSAKAMEAVRQPPIRFAGINLAGAEFGERLPGVEGWDYLYPKFSAIDYYLGLGFNLIRLPFRWERLQPMLGQPFSSGEEKRVVELASYITGRQGKLLLDPHNYARRKVSSDNWQVEHLIGSSEVPAAAFVEFWARLAALFRDNANVIFGLMNEPFDISAREWLNIVNPVIRGIRGQGASNLILVPGVAWSGAHSWVSAGNTIMAEVTDPARNFAFEVHQYFDADSSGTHPQPVSVDIGSRRIRQFEAWAREHRFQAFLGEFGASEDDTSQRAIANLCESLSASPDVWLGWAAWAGGALWPRDYMYNLDPRDGHERIQTRILASFAKQASG
jgi:endoglucanase